MSLVREAAQKLAARATSASRNRLPDIVRAKCLPDRL